jgi:multidrug resistance efflux pump
MDRIVGAAPHTRRKKITWLAVAVCLLLAVIGLSGWWLSRANDLHWVPVQRGAWAVDRTARATIVPVTSTVLTARADGAVRRVMVIEGATVESGQMLFDIQPDDLQDGLRQAEFDAAVARTDLEQARLSMADTLRQRDSEASKAAGDAELAEMQLRAERRLHDQKIVSDIQLRKTELAAQQARANAASAHQAIDDGRRSALAAVESAQLKLDLALEKLAITRHAIDLLRVVAPAAGVIRDLKVTPGMNVHRGDALATFDANAFKVALAFSEADVADLSPGMPVTLQGPNGNLQATLTSIASSSENGLVGAEARLIGPIPRWVRQNLTMGARLASQPAGAAQFAVLPRPTPAHVGHCASSSPTAAKSPGNFPSET